MTNTPKNYREVVEILVDLGKMHWSLFEKCGYEEPDYRATIFLNIKSFLGDATVICNVLLNVEEGRISPEQYRTLFGLGDINKIQRMADNLSQFTRLSLVTLIHFQIENLFVNLLKVITPNSKLPRGYGKILKKLFKTITISDKEEKIKILMILQAIRNTLHSNGIHNNDPLTKTIDGYEFEFVKGKGVNCANWTSIPIVIKATSELIDEIIKAPEIKQISEKVLDQHIELEEY